MALISQSVTRKVIATISKYITAAGQPTEIYRKNELRGPINAPYEKVGTTTAQIYIIFVGESVKTINYYARILWNADVRDGDKLQVGDEDEHAEYYVRAVNAKYFMGTLTHYEILLNMSSGYSAL